MDLQFDEGVHSLISLSSKEPKMALKSQFEGGNLKIILSNTNISAVFKKPLDTPSPDFKSTFYTNYSNYSNQGMMMGYIGPDNTLPAYEDLIPFNYELYKLIATNTISLCNFNGIENVDWYNLNLLAYVSSKKTLF